jgi:hypothetical protein
VLYLLHMEIKNIDKEIISSLRKGLAERIKRLAKEPFDGKTIQTVEKEFLETVGESGAAGLTELFIRNAEPEKRIIENDETHYRKFISTGKYLTLLGEVSLKRGIYQSNNQKRSVCPLEEKLNFINNYVSFAAAEYICYSMASMTLREFTAHCKKWTLMKPCDSTVRKVLDYVGHFLQESNFLDAIRSEEADEKEEVTLAVSMDATCINIKKEGWRHATAATLSTYDSDGKRLHTAYLGRMPETGKRKIKKLLHKEFEAKTAKKKFKNIVCIADGARDFWTYFRRKYPKAIHVIDFFHVCDHVSKLSELLFKNQDESKVWFKKYKAILKEDPNGAAKLIRAARYRRSLARRNAQIDSEIKYLQRNKKRMDYCNLRKKNLPIGSGVIEAACKNLIGARMKKSGMRWTIDGGQPVLTLRALILSNRWERFWNFFVHQHFPLIQT